MPSVCSCESDGIGGHQGWVYTDYWGDGSRMNENDPAALVAYPCVCRDAENVANRRRRYHEWANLPASQGTLAGYRRNSPAQEEAYEVALAFASGTSRTLVFMTGGPGTGKTHLATAAVAWLVGQDVYARYEFVPDLVDYLRQHQTDGGYEERIGQLQAVEALVLDDFGATQSTMTEWAMGEVYKLIDYRYRQRKPLLVTTNVSMHTLEQAEPRLMDRLMDRERSMVVVMDWESERRRA